jgi:hypothetical protein
MDVLEYGYLIVLLVPAASLIKGRDLAHNSSGVWLGENTYMVGRSMKFTSR